MPQIKQEMATVQQEVEKVDFNGLAKQVKASGIDKELSKVKQKIKEILNPEDTKGIKIAGLEDEKRNIKNVSEEYQKLKQKANELGSAFNKENFGTDKYYELRNELAKVNHELNLMEGKDTSTSGFKTYNSGNIQDKVENIYNKDNPNKLDFTISNAGNNTIKHESEKIRELKAKAEELGEAFRKEDFGTSKFYELREALGKVNHEINVAKGKVENYDYSAMLNRNKSNENVVTSNTNTSMDVQPSQQSLSFWDTLKAKIQQIKPQVQQVINDMKNVSISPNTKQLDLVKYKISEIEEKLQNAKEGKIHLNTKDIVQAEAQLEKLNNQKQKLESNGSRGNMFSTIFSSLKKINPQMNNVQGMAIKVKNSIKGWGSGVKLGIGQIMRYATALFGLRSIYSTLSGCANSWLSSQNAGAKQLSANIEYMKQAMRKCISSSYSIHN